MQCNIAIHTILFRLFSGNVYAIELIRSNYYSINYSINFFKNSIYRSHLNDINCRKHLLKEDLFLLARSVSNIKLLRQEGSIFYKNNYTGLMFRTNSFISYPFLYLQYHFSLRNIFLRVRKTYLHVNQGFYNKSTRKFYTNILGGFLSFGKAFKIGLFSLVFFASAFYVLLVKRTCVLPQTLFFGLCASMLSYGLLSGFVFFVKKYQYSRFTSVIQRFWRRSYILFGLIEGGLLLVFFYLTVNSSQETFYMFDQGSFLKTHLFSGKLFLLKSILVVSLITYSYLLLLNLKGTIFNKNVFQLFLITVLLTYLVWIEFYQIYGVSNFYANFSGMYDFEELIGSLEFDARRTRIQNHYIMILFLLKFGHIVFIFGCGIFFLLRANELETITYPLYTFNIQNFIILFVMMWLFMYPGIRHTFHWLGEIPYFWFYADVHISFGKILINDFIVFYSSIGEHCFMYIHSSSYNYTAFINGSLFDNTVDTNVFIKSTIKDNVLKSLI